MDIRESQNGKFISIKPEANDEDIIGASILAIRIENKGIAIQEYARNCLIHPVLDKLVSNIKEFREGSEVPDPWEWIVVFYYEQSGIKYNDISYFKLSPDWLYICSMEWYRACRGQSSSK